MMAMMAKTALAKIGAKIAAKSGHLVKFLAAWGLVLALAACVPETVHPLADPAQAKADSRLAGLWLTRIDNEEMFLHFIPRSDGWTEIVSVSYRNDHEGGEWTVFRMFPSRIDGRDYMNVRFIAEAEERSTSKRFYLARYQLDQDGALTLWSMKRKPAIAAIEGGLPGSVKKGRFVDEIIIKANTAELVEYLRQADVKALFGHKIAVFRRVRHSRAGR
jgi:hypothetical protein